MFTRRITRIAAAALAATAVGAPTAFAMPDRPISSHTPESAITRLANNPETVNVPGPTVVVEADQGSGFDWGSALIGAGVLAAIMLLAYAGVSTVSRHRGVRTAH